VYVNALVAAPLAAILVVATGELDKIAEFKYNDSGSFWFGFTVSCCMGLVLTYSSVLSTTYNSPLATSVTGNAKDIATTAIGWIAFSGFKATLKSVGGILISFAGAFLYSYVGLRKQMAASKASGAGAGAKASLPGGAASSNGGSSSPRDRDDALRHRTDEEAGVKP
jgi:drug/metabolite transporter (DMT)-like permease